MHDIKLSRFGHTAQATEVPDFLLQGWPHRQGGTRKPREWNIQPRCAQNDRLVPRAARTAAQVPLLTTFPSVIARFVPEGERQALAPVKANVMSANTGRTIAKQATPLKPPAPQQAASIVTEQVAEAAPAAAFVILDCSELEKLRRPGGSRRASNGPFTSGPEGLRHSILRNLPRPRQRLIERILLLSFTQAAAQEVRVQHPRARSGAAAHA